MQVFINESVVWQLSVENTIKLYI